MAWLPYSPDLNPIENLWDALGHAVSSRFSPTATLIELETALQEEWRLLNSAVCDHLIESMGLHFVSSDVVKATSQEDLQKMASRSHTNASRSILSPKITTLKAMCFGAVNYSG
ncbi:transposable element Tc3 transposase [Trichonephila clavipes]|uniref:Transposable element Tc3 transposase n=1 Tax=Trichonephila clavipes TaxID=2585209 RepID=A0A8X6VDP9_TRICX|nr:transposable element Tc3 transposase [Trichonephila clavipes]